MGSVFLLLIVARRDLQYQLGSFFRNSKACSRIEECDGAVVNGLMSGRLK
jgi:hypothetical protein